LEPLLGGDELVVSGDYIVGGLRDMVLDAIYEFALLA
jgi:hypothetical protein